MAAALSVVGFVADVAGIFPYVSKLFAPPDLGSTNVRIVLGLSVDEVASFGGNRPGVSLWDFIGNAIGKTDGTSKIIAQGNFVDIKVNPNEAVGNIQAEYISISNGGNDAVCVAGLAVTFPDGAVAAFSTDNAAVCGALWSNSNTPVLDQPDSGQKAKPKCVWIDRDGSNGIPHQGMGLHLPSFSNTNVNLAKSYQDNKDLMCNSGPRFRMYPKLRTEDSILVFPHPPEFVTDSDDPTLIGTDKDPGFIINNPGILGDSLIAPKKPSPVLRPPRRQRAVGPSISSGTRKSSQVPLAERLIISPHAFNSARELCESWNSFGHSFVSLPEGLFCDMTNKSLYYTCHDKIVSCCFDVDNVSFRACKRRSSRPTVHKMNGTSLHATALRGRQTSKESDTSWMRDERTYDSVQWW